LRSRAPAKRRPRQPDVRAGSRRSGIDCTQDRVGVIADDRPGVRRKRDNRYAAGGKVLLVAQIGVRRQQDIKPVTLGGGQQVADLKIAPAALIGEFHGMTGQQTRNGARNIDGKLDS
jgi:hypothetical protein